MELIAKNLTENILDIYMHIGSNIQIPGNGQVNLLLTHVISQIANSDIPYHIEEENIILNDGDKDLTKLNSLRFAYDAPQVEEVRSKDGKLRTHESSRPLASDGLTVLTTYFTGAGDDITNVSDVGNGELFNINHQINDSTASIQYIDFNIIENETWAHEAYLTWKDASYDRISFELVPSLTQFHIDATAVTTFDL